MYTPKASTWLFLTLCIAFAMTGCSPKISLAPPSDGVQVRMSSAAMTTELLDKLQDISDDPPQSARESESIGSVAAANITPVSDVNAFAEKLTFAKVTKTEGRIVWIEVTQ